MSVLDDFVQMRLYRKRAVELEKAAEDFLPVSVQRRYLVAADHYRQLADAEERSERARAISRLVHWKGKVRNPEDGFAQKIAFRRSPLFPADVLEEIIRGLLKRAAKNARLQTTSSLQERKGTEIRSSQEPRPLVLPRSDRVPLRKTSPTRRAKARARL